MTVKQLRKHKLYPGFSPAMVWTHQNNFIFSSQTLTLLKFEKNGSHSIKTLVIGNSKCHWLWAHQQKTSANFHNSIKINLLNFGVSIECWNEVLRPSEKQLLSQFEKSRKKDIDKILLTLRRPLRRKLRMWWFFDISNVNESIFLNRTSLTPSDFWCASFGKYRLRPFQISFFSGFYVKIMIWVRWFYSLFEKMTLERERTIFIHTNQPSFTSFYKKGAYFLPN